MEFQVNYYIVQSKTCSLSIEMFVLNVLKLFWRYFGELWKYHC